MEDESLEIESGEPISSYIGHTIYARLVKIQNKINTSSGTFHLS